MTNNTIHNVPRELLEELRDAANESMNATTRQHQIDHFAGLIAKADAILSAPSPADHVEDVRAMVAAPSPAGVDGLAVVQAVAWLNTATKEATTHPVVVMDWDDEKEPVESLMPISQHEAIIDGLRGEVAQLQSMLATVSKAGIRVRTDRDQQAQRIGELASHLEFAVTLLTAAGLAGNAQVEAMRAALSASKEPKQCT